MTIQPNVDAQVNLVNGLSTIWGHGGRERSLSQVIVAFSFGPPMMALRSNYGEAPYFKEIFALLEPHYGALVGRFNSLVAVQHRPDPRNRRLSRNRHAVDTSEQIGRCGAEDRPSCEDMHRRGPSAPIWQGWEAKRI